jgi:proline iminopeptidase
MTGLRLFSPEAWHDFAAVIPESERGDLLGAYMKRLDHPDPAISVKAAEAWGLYEARSSTLLPNPSLQQEMSAPAKATALARIEAHFFRHGCFLKPGQLIDDVRRIAHLPGIIVQGRYDLLCPLGVADRLHRAWPRAEYVVVPDAGYSAFEPGITRALIAAANRMVSSLAAQG